MPSRVFHNLVLTDDLDAVVRFLTEVAGLEGVRWFESTGERGSSAFGWPPVDGPVRGAVVGEGQGMVELVEIPAPLRPTVQPGLVFMSLATPSPESYADKAIAAGFDAQPAVTLPGVHDVPSTLAPVAVGGLRFEFIRFGS
jgi:catechol 2,3-dioxygenase-like lactoylglutathione lyase family enzyme